MGVSANGLAASTNQSTTALKYRFVGPPSPSRAAAIEGVPGDPAVAYLGAASGGVWKTTDSGVHWRPIFDEAPVQAIGALAVAPSNHAEIWAGTGESFYIRIATSPGDGVWLSRNAGRTWQHVGLAKTGRIAEIVVDPSDASIAYVCAAGKGFKPSRHRGVYRTTNAGKSWQRVLFVNGKTGCSDLAIDPRDPDTLFAGMWQFSIKPWKLDSGGPGGGVFVTQDGGESWHKIEGGLPTGTVGKVSVAISRSQPNIVFALISEKHGPGLYRSDDGGKNWALMGRSHQMLERPPYYTRLAVGPDDPDRLYFASVHFTTSGDGGKTVHIMGSSYLGDTHDLWIDPHNPKTIWIAFDEGVTVTRDRGEHWYNAVQPPIDQMYHVSTDDDVPYHVMGNRQDGIAYYGPSDSLTGRIAPGDWLAVGNGGTESGYTVPVPGKPIVWSNGTGGHLIRFNLKTRRSQDVSVSPLNTAGWPEGKVKNHWNWTFPLAVASWKHHSVFVGSQYVYESRDRGHSWQRISPDLTRNIKSHQGPSGGIVNDNSGTFWNSALSAIRPSPTRKGVLWAGSYDGLVHITRDGGRHWQNITPDFMVAHHGIVASISSSPTTPGDAYIALDRHLFGDTTPYIFHTEDYGQHWTQVGGGIPASPFSYVHTVAVDPVRRGLLFAGTDNGVFVSFDAGRHWRSLQQNLPHAPVYELTIQPEFHDLVVATFGRGIWILDDIRPLETAGVKALETPRAARLLPPRVSWRFRRRSGAPSRGVAEGSIFGQNPPYGALLDYQLPTDVNGPVVLTVENSTGKTIRTFTSKSGAKSALTTEPGLNRFAWGLRYPPLEKTKLRVAPPNAPWVHTAHGATRSIGHPSPGPLVPPGTYTVRLTANGQTQTQSLVVKKDPSTKGTVQDIAKQTALALRLYRLVNADVRAINRIEWLRGEISALLTRVAAASPNKKAAHALETADANLKKLESPLFDIDLTGAREDFFRHPTRLYARLTSLYRDVSEGDSDFAPTTQQRQVARLLHHRLTERLLAYRNFVQHELPELNVRLSNLDVKLIGLPKASQGHGNSD
jgi:photosystem II stability/assembly factor-like uncharacterized protein